MRPKQLLLFDLDGPILDVSERYFRIYSEMIETRGGRALEKEEYWRCKRHKMPEADILDMSGVLHDSSYERDRLAVIEAPQYLRFDSVWPGIHLALARLGDLVPILLVTLRRNKDALETQLETLGLLPYFKGVLTTAASGVSGVSGEAKAALVHSIVGQGPFDGWLVGDTETDLLCARRLGLKTVAVAYGIRDPQFLQEFQPDVMVQSPTDLIHWSKTISGKYTAK